MRCNSSSSASSGESKVTGDLLGAGVDTNAVIALDGGNTNVAALLDACATVFLPAPVYGELPFGACNSGRVAANLRKVEDFTRGCSFVPIDADVARRYAELRTQLRRAGTPIPENDLWIAATCLQLGVPLVTRDEHFRAIPGLVVRPW